ncbi:hypothetical protein BX600DRAFT_433833 [Xylariales sp. PMI_506]|nr:hypothetical protein BX600DRAFT_433833 [Xylariales sp. PMI_506]
MPIHYQRLLHLRNSPFKLLAIWTIDQFGRRALLLSTLPRMAWSLVTAGFCFWVPDDSRAHLGMITFFVFVFAAVCAPGEGSGPPTYSTECFSLSHHDVVPLATQR